MRVGEREEERKCEREEEEKGKKIERKEILERSENKHHLPSSIRLMRSTNFGASNLFVCYLLPILSKSENFKFCFHISIIVVNNICFY